MLVIILIPIPLESIVENTSTTILNLIPTFLGEFTDNYNTNKCIMNIYINDIDLSCVIT